MNIKLLSITMITAMLAVSSQFSVASGSYGGGLNSGANTNYHMGKALFMKKLACETCGLAKQTKLSPEGATLLVTELQDPKKYSEALTAKEKKAVIAYLKQRYKLK